MAVSACTSNSPHTAPPTPSSATAQSGSAATGSLQFTDITQQITNAVGDTGSHKFSFGRAEMTVPLNWADPNNGKTVTIVVVRARATSQHDRIGSLVINPGGPGASGAEAALELAIGELPTDILDRFDIIGFDPRGVGASDPIQCIPDKQKDAELNEPADPTTPAQWATVIGDETKVADECYNAYGSDLTYFSTAQTVHDMEALRAKLGDPKLTYLGYSYGTLLGAEYASAYPDKVRALVLDGAVDPTLSTVQDDKVQAAGFALAFSHFASDCTSGGSCKLTPDPQTFVLKLMKQADAHPIPSGSSSDPRLVKGSAVLLAVISALYDRSQWPQLTRALLDAANGNGSGVLSLDDQYNERNPDGTYTNIEDANLAISCADTVDRPTVAQAEALAAQWRTSNPLFGGSAAASLGFCDLWKAPPDKPITIENHNAPTILVVGTTGDPATPISGAKHLAALLGTADLLIWQGDGHTAYPKTDCVTKAVDTYLINLMAPAANTTCPAS